MTTKNMQIVLATVAAAMLAGAQAQQTNTAIYAIFSDAECKNPAVVIYGKTNATEAVNLIKCSPSPDGGYISTMLDARALAWDGSVPALTSLNFTAVNVNAQPKALLGTWANGDCNGSPSGLMAYYDVPPGTAKNVTARCTADGGLDYVDYQSHTASKVQPGCQKTGDGVESVKYQCFGDGVLAAGAAPANTTAPSAPQPQKNGASSELGVSTVASFVALLGAAFLV